MSQPVSTLANLMQDDDSSNDHIHHAACSCRPALSLCGRFSPEIVEVEMVASNEGFCRFCVQIWEERGCAICGCNAELICELHDPATAG